MDFGKLEDISKMEFALPSDAAGNITLLNKLAPQEKVSTPDVYVGCPIWVNKSWVGKIYPPHAKSRDYLKYYTEQFNTIELNTTHYHIPDAFTIDRWQETAQEGFKFCPKFPQIISHENQLEDAQKLTEDFCEIIKLLDNHLGVSFLQLPPNFGPSKLDVLEKYIEEFPTQEVPLAIEFRHADWFKGDNFERVAELLEENQISTVITDVAGRRDVLHMRLTTPIAFIRFVGNELDPSDYTRMEEWIMRLKEWMDKGVHTVYFFIHEPENDLSPDLVAHFIARINEVCNLNLKAPQFRQLGVQGTLF